MVGRPCGGKLSAMKKWLGLGACVVMTPGLKFTGAEGRKIIWPDYVKKPKPAAPKQ